MRVVGTHRQHTDQVHGVSAPRGDSERDPGVVVQRHLAAFSEGDLERMSSTLAPDASFVSGKTVVEPTDFPDFFGWAMQVLVPTIEIENLIIVAKVYDERE